MEHYQIINNSISKYNTDSQGVCPCQRMRTKGNKIVSLDKHIDLLNYTFEVIYGTESDLTARQVESACTALLERGGYSASVSHIIELQYNINRELTPWIMFVFIRKNIPVPSCAARAFSA